MGWQVHPWNSKVMVNLSKRITVIDTEPKGQGPDPSLLLLYLSLCVHICLCVWVQTHTCHCTNVEVRGQPPGVIPHWSSLSETESLCSCVSSLSSARPPSPSRHLCVVVCWDYRYACVAVSAFHASSRGSNSRHLTCATNTSTSEPVPPPSSCISQSYTFRITYY